MESCKRSSRSYLALVSANRYSNRFIDRLLCQIPTDTIRRRFVDFPQQPSIIWLFTDVIGQVIHMQRHYIVLAYQRSYKLPEINDQHRRQIQNLSVYMNKL